MDIVANYTTELFGGDVKFSFAYNWTDTSVDSIKTFTDNEGNTFQNITPTRIKMIEENLPNHRFNFTTNYIRDDFGLMARINYYGSYFEDHLDAGELPIDVGSEVTLDLEASYNFTDHFKLTLGAQNAFDNRPDDNPWAGIVGSKYPTTSPMGINGGFYYLKGTYSF